VELKKVVTTEFNIEGNPKEKKFVDLVLSVNPTQVTLVPDAQNQLTSNHGWDTILNQSYLKDIIKLFKDEGIRTSIFVDPVESMVAAAKDTGTDRIELYTESYASLYEQNKTEAIKPFVNAAILAEKLKLGLNAGHDLNLKNLKYFKQSITCLSEVSIGHALISDSLYLGLENTVQLYRRELM
jgi:pyridoxine 5-phosphate synthase